MYGRNEPPRFGHRGILARGPEGRSVRMAVLQQVGPVLTTGDTQLMQVAASCESVQDIINIAATAEAFAVTALGGALDNAAKGMLALNAEQQQTLRAARAEEQAHYAYLTGAKIVTDVPTFLKTLIMLE